jgi:hypothetical protein
MSALNESPTTAPLKMSFHLENPPQQLKEQNPKDVKFVQS